VLAGIEGGRAGLGELLAQGGRWRFGLGWYAIALFLGPLIALLALLIARALGGHAPASAAPVQFLIPIAAVGEEFGWRGYALPRLQRRMPPLAAALLIGIIWAAWHLPYLGCW
jgi:membrane protease YdiL (CAAX protease family)